MQKLIAFDTYPIDATLDILLKDRTTNENIVFATDAYAALGEEFGGQEQITVDKVKKLDEQGLLRTRVEKSKDEQDKRKRHRAEVFTPSFIVNTMNNTCDNAWFGEKDVFNSEKGTGWVTNPEPIKFSGEFCWQDYVDLKRLEITCGEAPFIVSRYDAATGEPIQIKDRIGMLDRKMRVINENASSDFEWDYWTMRAFQNSYGFELQGDNLLIARINMLMSYVEYYNARYSVNPKIKSITEIAEIISWNLWQMDGLKECVPYSTSERGSCVLIDWNAGRRVLYRDIGAE